VLGEGVKWTPDDYTWRDKIRDRIAIDLEHGVIHGLTYRQGKDYGLKTDNDVQTVQKQLKDSGHLWKKGRRFMSNFDQHQKKSA